MPQSHIATMEIHSKINQLKFQSKCKEKVFTLRNNFKEGIVDSTIGPIHNFETNIHTATILREITIHSYTLHT